MKGYDTSNGYMGYVEGNGSKMASNLYELTKGIPTLKYILGLAVEVKNIDK